MDPDIRNTESVQNNILKFIRPKPCNIFDCYKPKGIKVITRLRLGLSHICEHQFKHCFQHSLNTVFKIVLIIFAFANRKLKQISITYFTDSAT